VKSDVFLEIRDLRFFLGAAEFEADKEDGQEESYSEQSLEEFFHVSKPHAEVFILSEQQRKVNTAAGFRKKKTAEKRRLIFAGEVITWKAREKI